MMVEIWRQVAHLFIFAEIFSLNGLEELVKRWQSLKLHFSFTVEVYFQDLSMAKL